MINYKKLKDDMDANGSFQIGRPDIDEAEISSQLKNIKSALAKST